MNRNVALILYLFGASGSSLGRFKSVSEFSGSVLDFLSLFLSEFITILTFLAITLV